jgi:hypothetical protein
MQEYSIEKREASTHRFYVEAARTEASYRALRNPRVSAVVQQMNKVPIVFISGIANFVR